MDRNKSLFELIPQSIRDQHQGESIIQAGWAGGPGYVVRKTEDYPDPISLKNACTWLEEYKHIFKACHILFSDHSVAWIRRYEFIRYDQDDTKLKEAGCFIKVGSKTVNLNLDMEEVK